MKDRKFVVLSGLFFLLFIVGISIVALEKPVSRLLKASNVTVSPAKSFGVVFPQVGVAGDTAKEKSATSIKVSIYIRDNNGEVLPNRSVKLSSSFPNLKINPADIQKTNNIGQAEFNVTAESTGTAKLTATDIASNTAISNIPSVEFTE